MLRTSTFLEKQLNKVNRLYIFDRLIKVKYILPNYKISMYELKELFRFLFEQI